MQETMQETGTIFITVGEWFVLRNVLKTHFFPALREHSPNALIVFIVEYGTLAQYEPEFSVFPGTVVEEAGDPKKVSVFEKVVSFFARNGLATGVNEVLQHRAWDAGETYIPPFTKRWFGKLLGRSRLFQQLVRKLELKIQPSATLAGLFDRYKPSLVFGTTLINSQVDVPVLREALHRGIRAVAMTRSWDNLSGSGFLRVIPDRFFVQNKHLYEIAHTEHFVPKERMEIFGIPHYDYNFDQSLVLSREEFCRQVGLDPAKKIILYAAVGTFVFRKEAEMARILDEVAQKIGNAQVIFRLHPAFPMDTGTLATTRVIPDTGARLHEIPHLINTLYHMDVMVTIGSTMIIDAAAFDKPVVSAIFDGYSGQDDYWYSTRCFYDYSPTKVLLYSGAVRIVKNKEQLVTEIKAYLADPTRDKDARQKIIARFAAPYDGRAGERLADLVVNS